MGAYSSKQKKAAAVKPPTPSISSIDRAILDLKNARDRLQRYRNQLAKDEAKLVAQARKAKENGRKETALGLLRLRKYKQSQAAACEDQLLNILKMVDTIDSKQNESAVLNAMIVGKETLKQMHEERTVDDVLELMDEIREGHEVEQEINEILQGVPTLSASDEEEVEAELAALAAEMNGTSTTADTSIPTLPVAPTDKLPEVVQPATTAAPAPSKAPERVAIPG